MRYTRLFSLSFLLIIIVLGSYSFKLLSEVKEDLQSYPTLKYCVQYYMNKTLPFNMQVSIGDIKLAWQDRWKILTTEIYDISLNDHVTGDRVIIPKIKLGLILKKAMLGNLVPLLIDVESPSFTYNMPDTIQLDYVGYDYKNAKSNVIKATIDGLRYFMTTIDNKSPPYNMVVRNALFSLKQNNKTHLISTDEVSLRIVNQDKKVSASGSGNFSLKEEELGFEVTLNLDRHDKDITTNWRFETITLAKILTVLDSYKISTSLLPDILKNKRSELLGDISLTLTHDADLVLRYATLKVAKFQGNLHNPIYFRDGIKIDNTNIVLLFDDYKKYLTYEINTLLDDYANLTISGGVHSLFSDNHLVSINAKLDHFNFNKLARFWPMNLAHDVRSWLVNNIPNGDVDNLSFAMKFSQQDMLNNKLPADTIVAKLNFKDAQVKYYADMPEVHALSGKAVFSFNDVDITVHSGEISRSKIADKSRIFIPFDSSKAIKIATTIDGPAKDLTPFIPQVSIEGREVRILPQAGDVETSLFLSIPFAITKPGDMFFKLATKAQDVHLGQIIENLDISNMSGTVKVDQNTVAVSSTAKIAGAPITLEYLAHKQEKHDTFITDNIQLSASVTPAMLENMGFKDAKNYLYTGEIAATVKKNYTASTSNTAHEEFHLSFNADNAGLNFDELNINKPIGSKFSGKALLTKDAKIARLKLQEVKGNNIAIKGNIELDAKNYDLQTLHLEQFKAGDNDFVLSYYVSDKDTKLEIIGPVMDLQKTYLKDKYLKSSLKNKGVSLEVKVNNLKLQDSVVENMKASVRCTPNECTMMNIGASYSGNLFSLIYEKNNILRMKSSDIGSLLKILKISDVVRGGDLDMYAKVDTKNANIMNGTINMNHFNLYENSFLISMLRMSSLPGIMNLFSSKSNVPFRSLKGTIMLKDKVMTITDGVASGIIIGVTFAGTVDNNLNLDIKGEMVPNLYGINDIVQAIPLIGNILSGGHNRGFIAASYHVNGKVGEAKIKVNPLSMAVPGIIRRIFE